MIEPTFSPLAADHMRKRGLRPFDMIGFVFDGLNETNPAKAVDQLDKSYQHGGGWHELPGFKLFERGEHKMLSYPGDPPMALIAYVKLRDELIMLFESSWVCVRQPNGDIAVARMD